MITLMNKTQLYFAISFRMAFTKCNFSSPNTRGRSNQSHFLNALDLENAYILLNQENPHFVLFRIYSRYIKCTFCVLVANLVIVIAFTLGG